MFWREKNVQKKMCVLIISKAKMKGIGFFCFFLTKWPLNMFTFTEANSATSPICTFFLIIEHCVLYSIHIHYVWQMWLRFSNDKIVLWLMTLLMMNICIYSHSHTYILLVMSRSARVPNNSGYLWSNLFSIYTIFDDFFKWSKSQ